jgi:hypothetical protein
MSSPGISSITMMHACIEVIGIGVLSYVFNKRLSSLEAQVASMEQQLKMYDSILQRHHQLLIIQSKMLGANVEDEEPQ